MFNTPSHHRVHHGSDPIYLDKNYAGILIVWDRMFGTFQPELFRPTYGLTHPVETYNLVKLQYGHYAELWRDVRQAASWHDRLGYLFMPPDWQPGSAMSPTVKVSEVLRFASDGGFPTPAARPRLSSSLCGRRVRFPGCAQPTVLAPRRSGPR